MRVGAAHTILHPAERGTTFIELLVVAVLLLVVLGALFVTLMAGKNSSMVSGAYVHVQQETRRALDAVVRELREAGSVAAAPDGKRIDFQIVRGYNLPGECVDAICWGNETTPNGWVHYVFNQTTPQNMQLLRCATPNAADAIDPAACRVLGNQVNEPNSQFGYSGITNTVTIRLEVRETSTQLPGGSLGTSPAPLIDYVRLRNP